MPRQSAPRVHSLNLLRIENVVTEHLQDGGRTRRISRPLVKSTSRPTFLGYAVFCALVFVVLTGSRSCLRLRRPTDRLGQRNPQVYSTYSQPQLFACHCPRIVSAPRV